jgi:hypothetical protein
MSAKDIEVLCPCCAARLSVDVATGKILKSVPAPEDGPRGADATPSKDRWESAQKRVRDRTQSSTQKLESALEAERTKEARFDDLFKKARDKHERDDES